MKKKRKKVRIKFKNILLFLVILAVLVLIVYFLLNSKINNIYVSGNNSLSEQEIIDLSGISEYSKFYQISSSKISKRLRSNPLIEKVHIKKHLHSIEIIIEENDILLYTEYDSSILLSTGEKVYVEKKPLGIPLLANQVDEEYLEKFIAKMKTIDKNILVKISEISYDPTNLDNERFLLYMNDQNYVYLTLSKFNYINKYDELLPKLEGKKGILYLDSGNHFEIKSNN